MVQHRLCLRLEGAKITLPVQAKAERRVEDGAGVECKLGSIEGFVAPMAVRTIGPYIVTRRARRDPSPDRRGSANRRSPKASFDGSAGAEEAPA